MLAENGYVFLALALIRQTVKDLSSYATKNQASAKKFLCSKEFEQYCLALDFSPSDFHKMIGLKIEAPDATKQTWKNPREMTPEELREYRNWYRRQYNAKNYEKQEAYNAKRREQRRLEKIIANS